MPQQDQIKIDFEPIDFEPITETKPKSTEPAIFRAMDSITGSVNDWLGAHPTTARMVRGLFDSSGIDPNFEGPQIPLSGPGFAEIPGVKNAANWLANKIDNPLGEGGYFKGFAAGSIRGLGDLLSMGADPRAVGIKPNAPLPQIFEGPLPTVKEVGPRGLLTRGTTFVGGPEGVAETGRTYPIDIGPVNRGVETPVTVLPRELEGISELPADLAARQGLSLGKPARPELERPQLPAAPERKLLTRGIPEPEIGLPEETWRDRLGYEEPQFSRIPRENIKQDISNLNPKHPSGQQWLDYLKQLDSENAPDTAYRSILSTGGKNTLKRGETWRDQVIKYIKLRDENYNPPETEEPQFAKVGKNKAQISVNVRRSAKELTTGYSEPLPGIMAREGLQNAFDVIKASPGGKVSVKVDDLGIEIGDNGRGMSPDELYTVYTNLHESGKTSDTGATGGKGVGKAPYMLGGSNFQVRTVKEINGQKIESSFSGTPEELMEPFTINQKIVPNSTPTGTWFRTNFAEGQDSYDAKLMISKIIDRSRDIPGIIEKNTYGYSDSLTIPSRTNDTIIAKEPIGEGSNNIQLIIPKGEKLENRSSIDVHYLNNGMYQFSEYKFLGDDNPNLPSNLLIDIAPQVEEGHPKYPFPVQRESIKGDLKKEIDAIIDSKLVNPNKIQKKLDLAKLWDSMPVLSKSKESGRDITLFDPGNRLTIEESEDINTHPIINSIANVIDAVIDEILHSSGHSVWENRVKRVGLTLDPNMYGVHIPDPRTTKDNPTSAILINPFEHIARAESPIEAALNTVVTMLHESAHVGTEDPKRFPVLSSEDLNDPRVGKFLSTYLQQTLEQGGVDYGHGMAFIHRLGEIYGKFGTGKALEAASTIEQLISGPKPGRYSSEVQRLLQIYQDSRGRDAVTEDILSGTGVKQATRRTRKGNISGDDSADGAGIALEKLINAINEARPLRAEQEASYSAEKAERIGAVGKIKQKGLGGFKKQLEKLKGAYEKVEFEPIEPKMKSKEIDSLIDMISASGLMPFEQIRTKIALLKTIQGDLPQENELALLGRVFGNALPDSIVEMHAGVPFKPAMLAETAGIAKSLKSAFDFSATFRQGLALWHKKEFWGAFRDMFALAKDADAYRASQDALKDRPLYDIGHRAGLYLADISDKTYANKEEAFPSRQLSRGRYNPIGYSERAYTAFLNQLRANTFDSIIMKQGQVITDRKDMERIAKDTAEFVNNATGRGSLDFRLSDKKGALGNFEKSAIELNAAFYSPHLISSRVRMLGSVLRPSFYIKLTPAIRKEYLKSLLAIGGLGTLIGLAARQSGMADVSLNPTSADFGKIKIDKTRVDPFGGFQQFVVLTNKLISGESTSTTSGITREFGTGPVAGNRYTTIDQFRRNKMSPAVAFMENWLRGSNSIGEKWDTTNEITNLFMPMIAQDAMDLYKESPELFWLIGPDAFGIGVQSYEPKGNELGTLQENKELQPLR